MWYYIGTSMITEYPPGDINPYWLSIISFTRSVAKRNSLSYVATRRDPIHFETWGERKDPRIKRRGKLWAVEVVNSEVKERTATVEL